VRDEAQGALGLRPDVGGCGKGGGGSGVDGTSRRLHGSAPYDGDRPVPRAFAGETKIEWQYGATNIPAYFTAPNVNPCTRYRCKAANTIATGSVASKVAAIT
jgi:hypothetical protein